MQDDLIFNRDEAYLMQDAHDDLSVGFLVTILLTMWMFAVVVKVSRLFLLFELRGARMRQVYFCGL